MLTFLKGFWRAGIRDRLPSVMSALSSQQLTLSSSSDQVRSSSPATVNIPQVVQEKVGLFELSEEDDVKAVDVVTVHRLQDDVYKT